jgi:putative colanic acid biosynthesis glycosyltransferase WcaI
VQDRKPAGPNGDLSPLEAEAIGLFVQLGHLAAHPCKIYNILSVAAPVLYIGPCPSHLSELLDALNHKYPSGSAAHGDVTRVVTEIERMRDQSTIHTRHPPALVRASFAKETLLPRLVEELESR